MVSGGMVSAESTLHPAPITQRLLTAVTLLIRATNNESKTVASMTTLYSSNVHMYWESVIGYVQREYYFRLTMADIPQKLWDQKGT